MSISRHTRAARWGGALLVALAPLPWLGMGTAVANPAGQPGNESKVTICHRTNSVSNPYVVIRVAQSSVDGDLGNNKGRGDHYAEHRGPVFDPEADYPKPMSGDEWGDIIPPITGVHDGLNWTSAGIDIYYNDCNVGGPSPSESESSTPVTSSAPVTTSPPAEDKVTLCHRTKSLTKPYVRITVNVSAADGDATNDNGRGDHYLEHDGPLFNPEADYQPPFSGDEWGDIIPPIAGAHDGLNWTPEGIALYEKDCFVTVPSETESTGEASPSTSLSTPPTTTKPPKTTKAPKPSDTETKERGNPPSGAAPEVIETQSSAGALPQTGSGTPVAGAVGISLLLIGIGVLLLLGPGRLMPARYHRKH